MDHHPLHLISHGFRSTMDAGWLAGWGRFTSTDVPVRIINAVRHNAYITARLNLLIHFTAQTSSIASK